MPETGTEPGDAGTRAPPSSRRFRWRRLLLVMAALVTVATAGSFWLARSRGAVIAATQEVPIRRGETVVWCAVSQLAWDALADLVALRTLDVGAPAPAEVVEELNRRSFPHDAIDPASVATCAGIGPPGPSDADREAFHRLLGPKATALRSVADPSLAYAYAGLAKHLPFAVAFERLEEPLRFTTAPLGFLTGRRVKAFGWRTPPMARERGKNPLDAITVLFDAGEGQEFALEIRPQDVAERLVLARVDPGRTLRETWDSVARRAKAATAHPISEVPVLGRLAIPMVAFEAEQAFPGFPGAPVRNAKAKGAMIGEFTEWARFRLDERGAELEAMAGISMLLGLGGSPPTPRDFLFDRPFLLALRRANSAHPYFLMWIGNADVLVPAGG